MRLSKFDKECIIQRIMQDVPKTDYNAAAKKLIVDHFTPLLPPAIAKAIKDPLLEPHIKRTQVQMPGKLHNIYVRGACDATGGDYYTPGGDLKKQVDSIHDALKVQIEANKKLEQSLEDAFRGINTRKQALSVFPEFEKYLPAETSGTGNLPMVTTVISDLVQAGWPDGKKPAAKAAKAKTKKVKVKGL